MYLPGLEVSTSPLCFTRVVKSPSSLSIAFTLLIGSNVSPTRSVIVSGTVNSGTWFTSVFSSSFTGPLIFAASKAFWTVSTSIEFAPYLFVATLRHANLNSEKLEVMFNSSVFA